MITVKREQEVACTSADMYALVKDVARYQEFLPYCVESTVEKIDEQTQRGTLVIAVAGFRQSFTTENRLSPTQRISIDLVEGPFTHLEGIWLFDPTPTGCYISFEIELEFSSRVFSMMLTPVVDRVADKVMELFCERARELYGK